MKKRALLTWSALLLAGVVALFAATYTYTGNGFIGTFTSVSGGGWTWTVTGAGGRIAEAGGGDSAGANAVITFYGLSYDPGMGNQNET